MPTWIMIPVFLSVLELNALERNAVEPSDEPIRDAIKRVLPLLEKGAAGHSANRSCFACHNQGVPLFALVAAQSRGFAIDKGALANQVKAIAGFLEKNKGNFIKGKGTGGQVDSAGYALLTLGRANYKANEITDAVVEYLLQRDKDKDHWRPVSNRPPSEGSLFTTNYLGVYGLLEYGGKDHKDRLDERIHQVRAWVEKSPAKDTEDRIFRLWALKRLGSDAKLVEAAAQDLIEAEREGGGWSQLDTMEPDAYATGAAMVALREAAGLPPDDVVYARGIAFLLRTQQDDGSWHVHSRSKPFQTYFESGFPHGKDQFISMAASAWAANALILALPEKQPSIATSSQTIDLTQGDRQQVELDDRGRICLEKTKAGFKERGEFLAKPVDLGEARSIRVDWIEQWTAPQTWKKHPGNPIFGPNKTGPWDKWTNGVSIIRMADDKTYRMFYAGRGGGGIGFAEASIRDPLTWKEHPASPVLKPQGPWEGGQINQPRVVKVTDTHWRMYYTGWGFKGPGTTWAMGLAESFDAGLSWKRYQEAPILDRGDADSPDGGGACVPMVLKVGDQWMMWYTAALATPGKQNIHQCLATSPDGIRWTKYEKNPVLTDDFSTGGKRIILSRCYVRHDDGVFRMWYSYAKPAYRICYAESLDGKSWEKSPIEPVLGPSPAKAWDDAMVEYPEVDIVDGTFRLWFCGNGFGSVGYAEGVKEANVRLSLRTKNDGEWSAWRDVERGTATKVDRHVQIRCQMESTNPRLSPRLTRVTINK